MDSRSTSLPEDLSSRGSGSFGPEAASSYNGGSSSSSSMSLSYRPPPLRTARTYDDDDAFGAVALNLLSRRGAMDLSASEAIRSTLARRQERASFLEGLQHRRLHFARLSPGTANLVQEVDRVFGAELRRIVEAETASVKRQELLLQDSSNAMVMGGAVGSGSRNHHAGSGVYHHQHNHQHGQHQHHQKQPNKKSRRFFPDHGEASAASAGSSFFRSRKVQNIDFKLVEAISQVQSLRLDGMPPPAASSSGTAAVADAFSPEYEPPSMSY